jgi:hypothetical protein
MPKEQSYSKGNEMSLTVPAHCYHRDSILKLIPFATRESNHTKMARGFFLRDLANYRGLRSMDIPYVIHNSPENTNSRLHKDQSESGSYWF